MKDSHITKTRNRLYQKAKILISDPKFQEEVKLLREKWNISDGGFGSCDENEKWQNWLMESTDEFLDKNRSEESRLELQLIKHKDWKGKEKANQNFNNSVPINAFRLDLELLISKYKLSVSWMEPVKRYLMFNNVESMGIPGNVMIVTGVGKHGMLMLEINADTTIEDIKFMWPMVMAEQKKMPDKSKKFQPAPMLDIDKRAFELRNLDYKMSKIADTITEEFSLDIYTYKEAGESVKRHKKRLGRFRA